MKYKGRKTNVSTILAWLLVGLLSFSLLLSLSVLSILRKKIKEKQTRTKNKRNDMIFNLFSRNKRKNTKKRNKNGSGNNDFNDIVREKKRKKKKRREKQVLNRSFIEIDSIIDYIEINNNNKCSDNNVHYNNSYNYNKNTNLINSNNTSNDLLLENNKNYNIHGNVIYTNNNARNKIHDCECNNIIDNFNNINKINIVSNNKNFESMGAGCRAANDINEAPICAVARENRELKRSPDLISGRVSFINSKIIIAINNINE